MQACNSTATWQVSRGEDFSLGKEAVPTMRDIWLYKRDLSLIACPLHFLKILMLTFLGTMKKQTCV